MAENKAGGNNTPDKGEQGFQKSKAGKTPPTVDPRYSRAGVETKPKVQETYTGNDKVAIDYLKVLAKKHQWSTLENLINSPSWTIVQNNYILSTIYNEGNIWDTYYHGLEGIIKNLHLTDEDQKKLLEIDKLGNQDSPIIRGLATHTDLSQETIKKLMVWMADDEEVWKTLWAQSNGSDEWGEDLFELAKYGNAEVRQRVAEQENISLETFDLLMLDNNYDVLKSLAGNANLPKEYFRPLFDKVINAEYLHFTPEVHTYHTLVGQKTSSQPLGEYWLDNEKKKWFKIAILSNRHGLTFDGSILNELREDPSPFIRELVINNRNIASVHLEIMASKDKKRRVRKAARNELKRRDQTRYSLSVE